MTPRRPRPLVIAAGLALIVAVANLLTPYARGVLSTAAATHGGGVATSKSEETAGLAKADGQTVASLPSIQSLPSSPPPSAPAYPTPPSTAAITRPHVAPASSDGPSPDQALDLQLLNQTRARAGLGPVNWNPLTSAQTWAQRLAATHSQGDDPGFANGPGCAHAGNFAAASSVVDAHNALVASPPHYANMTGNYATVGIGVARDGTYTYVVEDYSKPC